MLLISWGKIFQLEVALHLKDWQASCILPREVVAEKSGSRVIFELRILGVLVCRSFHIIVSE